MKRSAIPPAEQKHACRVTHTSSVAQEVPPKNRPKLSVIAEDKPETYQLLVPTKIKAPRALIRHDMATRNLSVGIERPNASLQTQAHPFQNSGTEQNLQIYTIKSYHPELDNEK